MRGNNKKSNHDKDLKRAYETGAFDEDRVEAQQRFSDKSKHFQQGKTARTQQTRQQEATADASSLPRGEVIQVFSLFSEVLAGDVTYRCVQRKTLARVSATQIVVGDWVRFTPSPERNDAQKFEGVIEAIEDRRTVLMRADSFKAQLAHPIVANAEQMLIVASIHLPEVKWGLIDRMVVAARSGGLNPIVCLNKFDTVKDAVDAAEADAILQHYQTLGVASLRTSVVAKMGLEELHQLLIGRTTVLAGHSGVGKSSLVRAVEPALDLRVGEISVVHNKGMHTTTSARRYILAGGGFVVDTPGVKLFGLWNVTPESLIEYFPDVASGTAPPWRQQSYERILQSITVPERA
ncbi:MAG TPA: ribosome small subunit-dependent GTPase A [Tepidisphaeraceae bacterium]